MNRILLLLAIVVAAIAITWKAWDMFSPRHRPMLQGWDDSHYYFWLPSVVIDHDVDFSNQLAHSGTIAATQRDAALHQPRTATGLLPNKYPPGWALGSLPFFLAAHLVSPAGATGFEPIYLVSVWLGQFAWAVLGLWLAAQLLARWFPRETAHWAVLVGWLASPLVLYQTAALSMSHSQVFTAAVAAFWLAFQIRDGDQRFRTWALLGFAAALLVVTRNVCLVYLIGPAALVLPRCRTWRRMAALLAGAAVPVVVQLLAWKALYGSWIVYSYGGERFDFRHLHLAQVLFSSRHGWWYWHPLLLPAIMAFLVWSRRRPEAWGWVAALGAILLLNAAWPTWWLGSSFGNRGFEVATLFAMAGLAALHAWATARPVLRRLVAAGALLAIAWNLALLSLFLTHRIPREESVHYGDAARALIGWITGAAGP